MNKSHAWYALRRTLPPWRFDELLSEMIRDLPGQGVEEVIIKVDTEEFSHGFPSLEWLRGYQPLLFRAKEALESVGITYSLNPWVTIGHISRGRQMPEFQPAFQPVVGKDGVAESAIACPLSEGWRGYQAQAWTLYGETRPAVVWIEDDIRTFGAHFCLCPLHTAAFSARVGVPVTREELYRALTQPGEPHPWRVEFLRMQDQITREAAGHLAAAVHAASPDTRMGLMSSGPRNHAQEGRDWKRFAAAIQPAGGPLMSRPALGNYWEWDLRGLYLAQDTIKITRYALPAGAVDMTEVEAVPFYRTSNSLTFLAAKLWLSFAYGARAVTLNLYDHLGTPMAEVPQFGRLLGALKPRLDALATETQRPGSYAGIRFLHFDRAAECIQLDQGGKMSDLGGEGYGAAYAFETAGVPTTYEQSNVVAIIGQQARLVDDGELNDLLSRGLFLDGPAAHILCERGFGPQIGLERADAPKPLVEYGALSAEEHLHPGFDGAPRCYLSALLPNTEYAARFSVLHPAPGAELISRIVNPDTVPVGGLMTAYENSRGGRVIVHGWDYGTCVGAAYFCNFRTRQLQAVARWLFHGRAPLVAHGDGVWPLAFRKDSDGRTVTGLFQYSMDAWGVGVLTLCDARTPAAVERLDTSGAWSENGISFTRNEDCLAIRLEGPITYGEPAVARIIWAAGT